MPRTHKIPLLVALCLIGAVIAAPLLLGFAANSYCQHSQIVTGYFGYAANDASYCQHAYFLWGRSPSPWLLPNYALVRSLELAGVGHNIAWLVDVIFWIVTAGLTVSFALRSPIASRQARLMTFAILVVAPLSLFGAAFVHEPIGGALTDWEHSCVPLQKVVVVQSFGSCTVRYYNITNAASALAETANSAQCKSYAAIDNWGAPDALSEMATQYSELRVHSIMARCLCRADPDKLASYLLTYEVRVIGRTSSPRIYDPEVACNEL